jgi:hypothetical protein
MSEPTRNDFAAGRGFDLDTELDKLYSVRSLKESRTECPICARVPGEQHTNDCPRSMRQIKALQLNGRPRRYPCYLSKGAYVLPNGKEVYNPGVPWCRPPKKWFEGGLPSGLDRRTVEKIMKGNK